MDATLTVSNETAAKNRLSMGIEGLTCASCVARVEKAISEIPGVARARVTLGTESATVIADNSVCLNDIQTAVEKAGYSVTQREFALDIEGMTCASCVGRVEKALLKVDGVSSASVNLATESARIQVNSGIDINTFIQGATQNLEKIVR